jgi:ArsR family transcriptional regulator
MDPCKFFKCLADDTRLKSLLLINEVNEACVCNLIDALGLDQPKISRHLAELRKCGILLDERRGKWVYYKLHPALPAWAKNVISQTAKNNLDYIEQALNKLNASLTTTETCC